MAQADPCRQADEPGRDGMLNIAVMATGEFSAAVSVRCDRARASPDRHATNVVAAYVAGLPASREELMMLPPGSACRAEGQACQSVQAILSCSSPKSAMSLRVPPRAET